MRSGHNFLSGLVFNELFYQGLLKKYDQEIFILNKDENIKLLLSNKIITVRNVVVLLLRTVKTVFQIYVQLPSLR